jgi:hypothetical protein
MGTEIARAHAETTAPPSALFARWADMATWPEWNTDTEWVKLDGPFAEGATGTLKPKGGPKVPFVVATLVDGERFTDVSRLRGARLVFDHVVTTRPDGGSAVDVTITIEGVLHRLWTKVLGKDLAAALQPDLDRLMAVLEAASPAGAAA